MRIAAAAWKALVKQVTANLRLAGDVVVLDPGQRRMYSVAPEVSLIVQDELLKAQMPTVALDGKQLSAMATKRTGGDLEVQTSANALTVQGENLRYELSALPMPSNLPPNIAGNAVVLPAGVIDALHYAGLAAGGKKGDRDETLNVQLAVEKDLVTAVGTDGNRLNMMELSLASGAAFIALIPARLLAALRGLGEAREVTITDGVRWTGLSAKGFTSLSAVISKPTVQFPDWRRYIPKEFEFEAKLQAKAMHDALDEVGPMVSEDHPYVQLQFMPDRLALSSVAADGGGKVESTVSYERTYGLPPLSVYLQHRFLADYFAAVPRDAIVRFAANQPHKPVWLEAGPHRLLAATISPPTGRT